MAQDPFKAFAVSLKSMRRIIKDFHSEMAKGLSGKKSSLAMLPAYADRPTGEEKGKYLALDLGGTNFRVVEVELKGRGASRVTKVKNFVLDKKHLTGTADGLFDFLAGRIKAFIGDEAPELGFTFSFPVKQTGIASGTLLRWTKGFRTKGVIGKDVVKLLQDALQRKGIGRVDIAALANDTVGTLAAKSYKDRNCDVAVILGTGTNACYLEGRMIINTEWGNFNKLEATKYDRALDKASTNPGRQILEKMVSGMYLGEVARLVMSDYVSSGFGRMKGFKTEHMSIIEADSSPNLSKVGSILKSLRGGRGLSSLRALYLRSKATNGTGRSNLDLNNRLLVKKTCRSISLRAARISAAGIAAIVTKLDPKLGRKHTIAVDGSLYEKHPHFSNDIRSALKELFGHRAKRIRLALAKDGSGLGAAILAAASGTFPKGTPC